MSVLEALAVFRDHCQVEDDPQRRCVRSKSVRWLGIKAEARSLQGSRGAARQLLGTSSSRLSSASASASSVARSSLDMRLGANTVHPCFSRVLGVGATRGREGGGVGEGTSAKLEFSMMDVCRVHVLLHLRRASRLGLRGLGFGVRV